MIKAFIQYFAAITATTVIHGVAALPAANNFASVPSPRIFYDYIVVGGGAGGIPVADKLSKTGKSVLLLERGPPSTYRWGGRLGPHWVQSGNLTRFDVPGLDNELYAYGGTDGIACPDTDYNMAGCVLGGGTAINAGLWWKPNPIDWDYNFPVGWKAKDMVRATDKVFARIPGTDHPSMDGKIYYPEGQNVVGEILQGAGWSKVAANDEPGLKNRTFTNTYYMYSNGERGGPMATYLVSAHARQNFKLAMNTTVTKVIRKGCQITGVNVEASGDGGYSGIVQVTPGTGRVILSAGAFNTPKILFRSGIGPTDMLNVVKSTGDGPTMIDAEEWINLPVGYNVNDNAGIGLGFDVPGPVSFDFNGAYLDPNAVDSDLYLNHRSGILTQAAPNIGPVVFDEILGSDGITRQLSWTAYAGDGSMYMQQNLGRGATSHGRISITVNLTSTVSTLPYYGDPNDVAAVIQGFTNIMTALSTNPNVTFTQPAAGTSVADYVQGVVSSGGRGSNHWTGSAQMGTVDGRTRNGTSGSVVDTNTKVYGTNNLFIVDASIIPGQLSANPSSTIVILAEKAAELILALK